LTIIEYRQFWQFFSVLWQLSFCFTSGPHHPQAGPTLLPSSFAHAMPDTPVLSPHVIKKCTVCSSYCSFSFSETEQVFSLFSSVCLCFHSLSVSLLFFKKLLFVLVLVVGFEFAEFHHIFFSCINVAALAGFVWTVHWTIKCFCFSLGACVT
jgi:hypothetical protein